MTGFFHSRRSRFTPAFRDVEACNCELGMPCAEHESTPPDDLCHECRLGITPCDCGRP